MPAQSIAIVGAGIAGLNAAYHLKQAGHNATIYEAQDRLGGRIYSVKDRLGPGLVTELGAELINSTHEDILGLIDEFNLPKLDRRGPTEAHLRRYGYYYEGSVRLQEGMVEHFRPMQKLLDADIARLDDPAHYRRLDQMTAAEYIDSAELDGWVHTLLHTAIFALSGRTSGEQSALNMVGLYPHIRDGKVWPYGKSDGRYSVLGGNSQIVDALAQRIDSQIETSQVLEAIRQRGSKLVLTLNGRDIEADYAVIAIPFSVLRHVQIDVELKPSLRRFINEFNYGWCSKLHLGFDSRPWRDAGYTGSLSSDIGCPSAWDGSQCQPTEHASLTFYTCGDLAQTLPQQSVEKLSEDFVSGYDKFAPGTKAAFNGRIDLGMDWPSFEFTQGAYGCAGPGQYTDFVDGNQWVEGDLNGIGTEQLLFAGEHVSAAFQGHMNGAAQTGRLAAANLLTRL